MWRCERIPNDDRQQQRYVRDARKQGKTTRWVDIKILITWHWSCRCHRRRRHHHRGVATLYSHWLFTAIGVSTDASFIPSHNLRGKIPFSKVFIFIRHSSIPGQTEMIYFSFYSPPFSDQKMVCILSLYIVTFSWVILIEITRIQWTKSATHWKTKWTKNARNNSKTPWESSTKLLMVDDLDESCIECYAFYFGVESGCCKLVPPPTPPPPPPTLPSCMYSVLFAVGCERRSREIYFKYFVGYYWSFGGMSDYSSGSGALRVFLCVCVCQWVAKSAALT